MYKQIKDSNGVVICIQRIADNAFIPLDDRNGDYQQYKEWLAAGGKPL